jgi:hypothetical protein
MKRLLTVTVGLDGRFFYSGSDSRLSSIQKKKLFRDNYLLLTDGHNPRTERMVRRIVFTEEHPYFNITLLFDLHSSSFMPGRVRYNTYHHLCELLINLTKQ